MDVLQFVSSLNKVSLFAFVVMMGFLIYEILLVMKGRSHKEKPSIPQFNPSAVSPLIVQNVVVPQKSKQSASHLILIVILIMMVVSLAGFTFYTSSTNSTHASSVSNEPQIVIRELTSKGISLYTTEWGALTGSELLTLAPGDTIICAVATIPGFDIDKARIRINESTWNEAHITTQFNKSFNVFYREYTISSETAKLTIEAQLHSAINGWLEN